MELTDGQLIQNTLNGDHDSFAELVRRYQNRVQCTCMAKNWRFSCCRRDYTGYLLTRI